MFDALYNNESKLDQIMTEGFKRMDEAVERVIGKYDQLINSEAAIRLMIESRSRRFRLSTEWTSPFGER